MNVLLLSTSLEGGAGGAAATLHKGLRSIGVTSNILVQSKSISIGNGTVITGEKTRVQKAFGKIRKRINKLPLLLYPNRDIFLLFSPQWFPDSMPILRIVEKYQPNIINLHWICGGFIKIETISKFKRPLVWTLHDMWPFTGGCHHSLNCERYTEACGQCPQLESDNKFDLSNKIWTRKKRAWKDLDLTVVSPSKWLAKKASFSSLFRDLKIEVIPHGIDTNKFKQIDTNIARDKLGLPKDVRIVLFGAWMNNPNKGFQLLQKALQSQIFTQYNDLDIVVFGFDKPRINLNINRRAHYLGRISPDMMPLVYSAADVYVAPSIVETFGLTIIESLSCGTPVVAFDITGPKELIMHKRNGYLAKHYDYENLAQGITWIIEDTERQEVLARNARKNIEKKFSLELMINRYLTLFNDIIDKFN